MTALFSERARDAAHKSAFFGAVVEDHPHGVSGSRWIITGDGSCSCWDTHPLRWRFSEFGNDAGLVD